MDGAGHSDDTPPRGFQHGRLMTPSNGSPVLVVERQSRQMHAVSEHDAGSALDPLDERIDARLAGHMNRRFRGLWRGLAGVAGVALGALVAAGKAALDDARTEGADKYRIEIIERDLERAAAEARTHVERLRFEIDALRSELYYRPVMRRRDDQPDAPTGASPRKP